MQIFYTTFIQELYKNKNTSHIESRLQNLVDRYKGHIASPLSGKLTERDSILITYPDQVRSGSQAPLTSLVDFCETYLAGVVSDVHVLPFFPSSSDGGFAVKDYRAVDPALGTWEDIERLAGSFRLMMDGVVNHASTQGDWFKAFLQDQLPYRDYFITVNDDADLSKVVRPRTTPLVTEFKTSASVRKVWTTFGADQADLEYHNPDVLLEMLDILLNYLKHGVQFIRLDAIAYLWKEIGTTCINLPQAHAFVRLLRAILNEIAPHVHLVTETNVPHQENLTYFGNGENEAQLIYNFALPPLVLHTFWTGDVSILSRWASELTLPSNQTTYLNFLASHDGIGLNPARGILAESDVDALIRQTTAHGGLVSYGKDRAGKRTAYELNINYFDALSDPSSNESIDLQMNRFMAAQAILCSLRGVPAIYFHSLFGSRNWREGVRLTGQNRAINRQQLERYKMQMDLADEGSLRSKVYSQYRQLLRQRSSSPAFDPYGDQKILDFGTHIFAVLRTSPSGGEQTLCLHNVTSQRQSFEEFILEPYQVKWLNDQEIPLKYSND